MKVVTIDGPAGSGKSSVAKTIAHELGWTYVTTGAIYRAVGLVFLESNSDFRKLDEAQAVVDEINRTYRQDTRTGQVFLGEREVTQLIRSPKISEMASFVAENPLIRKLLLPLQRKVVLGAQGAVVDGRDMGTVVFPDAPLKIFLTASPEERARRRAIELRAQGKSASFEEVVKEIHERDLRDSSRECAPMLQAEDAVLIDSTQLNVHEVIKQIVALCRERQL